MTTFSAEETYPNSSAPLALESVEICGVASEYVESGEQLRVWTRLAVTSEDKMFHPIVESLNGSILHMTKNAGKQMCIRSANSVLLVIRPDKSAKLWVDSVGMTLNVRVKEAVRKGDPIYDHQITDVLEMNFPDVPISSNDGVVFLFRVGWRFALFFDFNPDKSLNVDEFQATLGALYRHLKYRETYDAVSDVDVLNKLFLNGWFPFFELTTEEFLSLTHPVNAGRSLERAEADLLKKFDEKRIENMFQRWLSKPHFADKEQILRSAIENFHRNDPISTLKTLKTLMTEIEGILATAHLNRHGTSTKKTDKLAKFATEQGKSKARGSHTLYFPEEFGRFLKECSFQNYDPNNASTRASSRHAVSHGGAAANTYTMAHALQAILILDQIAIYT